MGRNAGSFVPTAARSRADGGQNAIVVEPHHDFRVANLPGHHDDPFSRLLVVAERKLAAYDVECVLVG